MTTCKSAGRPAASATSAKRALSIWGPGVPLHIATAKDEVARGLSTARILHKLSRGDSRSPLDWQEIEALAVHLNGHFLSIQAALGSARACFEAVQHGGRKGGTQ